MKEETKVVSLILLKASVFYLIALPIPFLAYYGVLMPVEDQLAVWFQRSGSLITIFAVIAELTMLKIPEIINADGNTLIGNVMYAPFDQGTIQEKLFIFYRYLGGFLIILGTIIWGYGDLIYLALN